MEEHMKYIIIALLLTGCAAETTPIGKPYQFTCYQMGKYVYSSILWVDGSVYRDGFNRIVELPSGFDCVKEELVSRK